MNYVGKPLAYVLATPEQPDDADNPLRVAFGNEASDRDIAEFGRRFGCTVWDGFGSTETAVIITRTDDTPLGSIGQPFDGVAVYDRETRTECPRAVFDDTGAVANLDECVGELVNTTGAGFFGGYYNDEAATASRLDGGMYWSGDLGYRDDARLHLPGRPHGRLAARRRREPRRRADRGAAAAAPGDQPGVRLRRTGPARRRPADGDPGARATTPSLDPAGFEAFLAEQADLSPKAWPRYVRIADRCPRTATNKVLKRALRAEGTTTADPVWEREERGRSYSPATSGRGASSSSGSTDERYLMVRSCDQPRSRNAW